MPKCPQVTQKLHPEKGLIRKLKSYVFKIVIEADPFDDGKMAYHAYAPALEKHASSTWGYTKEEALKNIQELVEMIIDELIEEGEPIPTDADTRAQTGTEVEEIVVAVTR